jgi:hypothetical protein
MENTGINRINKKCDLNGDYQNPFRFFSGCISFFKMRLLFMLNSLKRKKRNEIDFIILWLERCRALRPRIGIAPEGPKSLALKALPSAGSKHMA